MDRKTAPTEFEENIDNIFTILEFHANAISRTNSTFFGKFRRIMEQIDFQEFGVRLHEHLDVGLRARVDPLMERHGMVLGQFLWLN